MNKTLEQWIALYDKKIPEKFKRDERFELFYLPEKGFAEIIDTGKMVVINQMCGELKFWREVAEKISRRRGYKIAGTICVRPILPYLRLAGFKIEQTVETIYGDRYFCADKHTGQRARVSPTSTGDYLITWGVTTDDRIPI